VAGLATLLGGQAWLAVDVLLLGCVPIAGLTAYLATRRLVTATFARVLLAASYALLPVATGAVAAGRLGTAVAFMLLPLIGISAGRMLTAAPRKARRAAWATGLLIAVAAAFAPLIWVLGLVFAVGALAARRWLAAADPVNAAIVVAAPFFVLFPWSLHLLTSPSAFLSEAGVSTPGLTTRGLSPTALLALSPGGPGVPPVWVTIGLGLALLALLLPVRRAGLVIAGWVVAIAGILAAVVVSRVSVTPPAGGQPASGWPGVAMALAALGLLLASAPAAQWLASIIPNGGGQLSPAATSSPAAGYARSRRLLACVALAAAATAPLLVAAYWVKDGVRGPVGGITAPLLPAFVSASSTSGEQYRTLILRPDGAGLDYLVVRQEDPTLGEPELGAASAAGAALSRQVAALGAPNVADAGDPGLVLGSFGIRWVLLPAPVDPVLAQRFDAALGLVALNKGPAYDLWQVTGPVARVRVVADDGTTTALSSGPVDMSGVTAPAGGGTLVLAEPYGGWTATLNGHALKPVATPVNGWAQGFVLPPGGGQLSITRNNLARMLSLFLELIATLAICLLALPGKRTDPVEEAEALTAASEPGNGKRAAGSTRRAALGVRADGAAGHRAAAGAVGRLGFARKRSGQPQQPGKEPAKQVPASQAAAGETPAARVAEDAEAAGSARPKAATAVSVADGGRGGYGGHAEGAGGSPAAPWDMAGDWGTASGTAVSDAWGADPPEIANFREGAGLSEGAGFGEGTGLREGTGPQRDDLARLPGQRASTPESPVMGTPVPETGAPWDTGPQRAPWDTGRQAPASSAGTQPRYPWDSRPQAPTGSQPASRTGSQPASWTGPRPVARTDAQPASGTGPEPVYWTGPQPTSGTGAHSAPPAGARPASRTGSQPASPAGAQPASGTGPQRVSWARPQPEPAHGAGPQRVSRARPRPEPASGTGGQPASRAHAQPAAPAGTQPVPMAPWESGDWGKAPDWDTTAGNRDVPPAPPAAAAAEPERAGGSGASPVTGRPARPERHSHRAAKHGKPSRWRGSGNRSTGDGES